MASSSKGGGGGGGAGGSSPANSSSTIYPASFIKRNLVPGADSYRQTLTALRDMDKDAVAQRGEYWRMEDALVEKAAKLLTSKDSSPEDIQAFLSSSSFTALSTHQQHINEIRTQTLRLATAAYDKVDDSIQALDWDISMLEPQMAAAAAEDITLDPQILAIKRKEQRKAQRQEKQRAKEMAAKKKKKLGKGGKDTSNDLGLVPSVGQGQGTPGAEEEVDPNEPVYCTCQRVSYGQMVGCDNEDCTYEWFHLDCVGLLESPRGSWLCPDCCVEKGLVYQGVLPPTPMVVGGEGGEEGREQKKEEEKEKQEAQGGRGGGAKKGAKPAAREEGMAAEEEGGAVEEGEGGGGGGVEEGKEEAVPMETGGEAAVEEEGARGEEGEGSVPVSTPAVAMEEESMS